MATTNPACVTYDPSFAFEIPVIVEEALRRMYGEQPEDVFYYLTVYNEPFVQPPMPEGLDERLILQGLYRYQAAKGLPRRGGPDRDQRQRHADGPAGRQLLAEDWDVAADVWSAPGWQRLRADALDCDEWNRLHPTEDRQVPW